MRLLERFKKDQSGATAILFGLSLIPVMGIAGAALDYSRATSGRTHLQKAVDGAAIALAREAGGLSDAQLQQRGADLVKAYIKAAPDIANPSFTVKRDAKTIRVAAAGSVKTAMMGVLGFNEIAIGSDAEVAWGSKKIELALVLDNTGSMGSKNKLQELKKATYNLLDKLETASPDKDAIKVSIVPFNTKVNVGKHNAKASWLAFEPGHSDPALRMKEKDWTGCVTDRAEAQNLDIRDDGRIAGDPSTLHLATVCGEHFNGKLDTNALAEIRPLTSNFADLRATVGQMKADGCTNITIGAAWGLDSLSKDGPLSGGVASGTKNVEKIMVVLTDGNNTRSRAYKNASHCNEGTYVGTQIDQRTRKVCDTIKSEKIRVYTIRVIEGNAKLLKDCASVGETGQPLYFDVQDAAKLQGVFQAIVNDILGIRLTH